MKSRVKKTEECSRFFRIEIPHDLVMRTVKEVYKNIKKIARIPGFRVGFAPQDLLEKHYSKDAEEEILKRLIPEGYKNAVETHKIIPVGMPRISNINFRIDKPLTFEAQVDTRPNIKLRNYKGIKITKNRISISKEELDEAFSRLRNAYVTHNDVMRPANKGDYVVWEVEAFSEGKPISKKNQNMWISVDKEASLLGMGEELAGLTKGQAKEIETKLPANYPDKKYAGKSARFKVLVNAVKEKALPAMDDAFAKKLNVENMDALKKEIESGLFARKENAIKINMENQILDRLLKDNRVAVPLSLVNRQKEIFRKRMEEELLQKGIHKEEIEKRTKELEPKLNEEAKGRVQVYFILDDIALKEKIEATDDDLEERIASIAQATARPKEEVRKYYEKENLLGGLSEEIKETKVLDFLLKQAEVSEGR